MSEENGRLRKLPQVAGALADFCLARRPGHGGEMQARQQEDHRDEHEQFDDGEGAS